MATLRIEGGRRLEGKVTVEGNKNAALPLLAACRISVLPLAAAAARSAVSVPVTDASSR